jgi:succinyl-CoA synthetase alpha subunit
MLRELNSRTKVIVQGITGREAMVFTKDMLDYGTNVVGGVTPGKGGMKVHGLPVYDGVNEIDAEVSVISVPPAFAKDAVMEAIEAGIKLVVLVTERIPRKDVAEILEFNREMGEETKIVGPNSLGVIKPERVKVGMIGGSIEATRKAYTKGNVAILSRSGGMTTELASLLTQQDIGQSICVSIGGDPMVGTTFQDAIIELEKDKDTKGFLLFCEPGGLQEELLAEYIIERGISKPVCAFIAGKFVDSLPGRRFGHAGVIVHGKKGSVEEKKRLFEQAGVIVCETLSKIPEVVEEF